MSLSQYVDTLALLGDENRIRLCALLRDRELCVTDLVRVTGMAQSRVSTHLGRLRKAGFVVDRRKGAQSFYALASNGCPTAVRACLDEAAGSGDPTLEGDQKRLRELEAERRDEVPQRLVDELDRDYSPGRTWQSLTAGIAPLLQLGDVLDVGSGDGAAASVLAPYCRSLTCIDTNERLIAAARERLGRLGQDNVRTEVADVHAVGPQEARAEPLRMMDQDVKRRPRERKACLLQADTQLSEDIVDEALIARLVRQPMHDVIDGIRRDGIGS